MNILRTIGLFTCLFLVGCTNQERETQINNFSQDDLEIRFIYAQMGAYLTFENHSRQAVSIISPVVIDFNCQGFWQMTGVKDFPKEASGKHPLEKILSLPPGIEVALPISEFRDDETKIEIDSGNFEKMLMGIETLPISFKIGQSMDGRATEITGCTIINLEKFDKTIQNKL